MNVNSFQQFIEKLPIIDNMEFKDWIWDKFVTWRGKSDKGITDFADYLGVNQPTLSGWTKGPHGPTGKNLARVASKYPDVYEVLGLSSPVGAGVPSIYVALLKEIKEAIEKLGVEPESPEAVAISNEILDRFVSSRKVNS